MDLQSILTTWSFEPSVVIGVAFAALLYARGLAYSARRGIGPELAWWRIAAFYAGLLIVFIALESVVDVESDQFLWVHMIQHDLLTLVGPPLILLGAPLWPMWRGVPRRLRLNVLRWMVRTRWPWRTASALWSIVEDPRVGLCLFLGFFSLWHLPVLYNAALDNTLIHIVEHACFFATALIFFGRVLPLGGNLTAHAKRLTLAYPKRALYLIVAATGMNVLGEIFIFSTAPFYAHYIDLLRTPQMPSALTDQHLAGAAMGVPSAIVFFAVVMWTLTRWLRQDEEVAAAEEQYAGQPAGRTVPSARM
jgi:putative membrane protein